MNAEQVILSRLLPKTGQLLPRAAGDDGDLLKGWWKNQRLNGELPRFVKKYVGEEKTIIDRVTGLTWSGHYQYSINNSGNALAWIPAVAFPFENVFAGFDDWRLPNVLELVSIVNFGLDNPASYREFFALPDTGYFWSSTTCTYDINKAFYIDIEKGWIYDQPKAISHYLLAVRDGV